MTAANHPSSTAVEPSASLRDETRAIFRAAVLDAAEEEFAQRGFEAARMQDVAKRARVAVGTVYNHFANKEDLLAELLRVRGDDMFAAFAAQPGDPTSFEGRFLTRFGRMQTHLAKHRAFFAVMMRSGMSGHDHHDKATRPESIAMEKRMSEEVQDLLVQGIAEGVLAPDDTVRLGRYLKGAMRTVMIEAITDGASDIEAQGAWVLQQFLRGARASGEVASSPKTTTRKTGAADTRRKR